MKLEGKTALVTGSTRGIGKAIALELGRNGADVAINGTKGDLARQVSDEIKALGRDVLAVPCDVTISSNVKDMVQKTLDHFGKIDILVCCAGITGIALTVDTTDALWNDMFAINTHAVFYCCREVAKHMIERKGGKIINIGSFLSKTGAEYYPHYTASKFAVAGFSQALAKELAPYNINVNVICPGQVDTDMLRGEVKYWMEKENKTEQEVIDSWLSIIAFHRLEKPEEVAKLALFLASSDSDYITSLAINVDGGIVFH